MKDVFCDTTAITHHYGEYIDDVRRLLAFHGLSHGSAEDFSLMTCKLQESSAFRVDFSTLIRSAHDREQGKMSADQMLTVLALASGGDQLVDGRSPVAGLSRTLALLRMLLAGVGLWSETNDLHLSKPLTEYYAAEHLQASGNFTSTDNTQTEIGDSASARANLHRELTALRLKLDLIERRVSETNDLPLQNLIRDPVTASPEISQEEAGEERALSPRIEGVAPAIPKVASPRRMQSAIASGLDAPLTRAEQTMLTPAERSEPRIEARYINSEPGERDSEHHRLLMVGETPRKSTPLEGKIEAKGQDTSEARSASSTVEPRHTSAVETRPASAGGSAQGQPSPVYQDERLKAVFLGLTRHPGGDKVSPADRPRFAERMREHILALKRPRQRWLIGTAAAVLLLVGTAKLGWQTKGDGPTREIGAFASETREPSPVRSTTSSMQNLPTAAIAENSDAIAKLEDRNTQSGRRVDFIPGAADRPLHQATPRADDPAGQKKGKNALSHKDATVGADGVEDRMDRKAQETSISGGSSRNGTLEVASSEMQKHLLFSKKPVYPREALGARAKSDVVLNTLIGRDGTVRRMDVVEGEPAFIKSAMAAVSWRRYEPYRLRGKPVDVMTQVTIRYPPQ